MRIMYLAMSVLPTGLGRPSYAYDERADPRIDSGVGAHVSCTALMATVPAITFQAEQLYAVSVTSTNSNGWVSPHHRAVVLRRRHPVRLLRVQLHRRR